MNEERLEALMIRACELNVSMDFETITNKFASNSSVLTKLLIKLYYNNYLLILMKLLNLLLFSIVFFIVTSNYL